MVDNIVWSEPHTKEGTSWMKVTGHASATIDILTNTLWGRERERGGGEGERERERVREIKQEEKENVIKSYTVHHTHTSKLE